MGTTLWVLRKSRRADGDDYDHSAIYKAASALDALADEIGVRRLSDFFDWTDFKFNSSNDALPESWIAENEKWHAPDDAISSVRAVLDHLKQQDYGGIAPQDRVELVDELGDCLRKLGLAKAEGDAFQFCVVM